MSGTSSYPPRGRSRVLLVDDDRRFLLTLEAILSSTFDTACCAGGAEAMAMDLDGFHVVCADYNMPGMTGLELLARVSRQHPSVCCLLMTGADDFFDTVKHAAHRPPVIFKPMDPDRMMHTIAHLASIAAMKRSAAVLADSSGPPSSLRSTERDSGWGDGSRGPFTITTRRA
jgi:DNA-binding NtrC family response regulator